jgi:hypothetical protein
MVASSNDQERRARLERRTGEYCLVVQTSARNEEVRGRKKGDARGGKPGIEVRCEKGRTGAEPRNYLNKGT